MKHLFCFGFGFSCRTLATVLRARGWRVSGVTRSQDSADTASRQGFDCVTADQLHELPATATHLVASAPPDAQGDPFLSRFAPQLCERASQLAWAAYLSTTGVYGNHDGAWVTEDTPYGPSTARGERRVEAEQQWMKLHLQCGLPLHIFRLAGIYGPGRNQLLSVRDGTAKRIIKPGQVFSRIHVEDVAGVLLASMDKPSPGRAYNVADDLPCPPQDVVSYAAALLDRPRPPEMALEAAELSAMARSFYAESKSVSNQRIKQELGYRLRYPDYRRGLAALLHEMN